MNMKKGGDVKKRSNLNRRPISKIKGAPSCPSLSCPSLGCPSLSCPSLGCIVEYIFPTLAIVDLPNDESRRLEKIRATAFRKIET
jgi:hypothetical protein